jgi:hypothetical protein
MYSLRFRQIHLDFHTSPAIPGVGKDFDKKHWQETLRKARVNSVTCFSKCHHGWSYHPTKVGRKHPHLTINLLRAQMDACKEIDVNVPIYISAGVDNVCSYDHPEWREINVEGRYGGWVANVTDPGFHKMCFHTPYLDYLCAQIEEAVRMFPEGNGVFLDIISQGQCCCRWCLDVMKREGLDPAKEEDRRVCAQMALRRYYERTTASSHVVNSKMPVFHNSGHVQRGERSILKHFSHLELESLPTGGWGYDHFPLSAKYCQNLGFDYLGMTGKFHTTWGEFGGYKHPNALRYECAAMLAYGSKCGVGDQLHPRGKLDESTYEVIGAAYREVEKKESWCNNVKSVADIGLMSSAATGVGHHGSDDPDVGAARVLLEGHFLFDVLDAEMDVSPYKVIVLPDSITVDKALKAKLDKYLVRGGKLFVTGKSAMKADGTGFLFNIPATWHGESAFEPDYVVPRKDLQPSFVRSPLVMYVRSQRIKAKRDKGESLGAVYEPYFNRSAEHFCSHQHTPYKPQPSGFDCGVLGKNILYLAHPVFTLYKGLGAVAYKEYVVNALNLLLGSDITLTTNLPSTGRVTLMEQLREKRYVLHLLYANTVNRGGQMSWLRGGSKPVEVIEELLPLPDVEASLRMPRTIKRVTLEPQGREFSFEQDNGQIHIRLDKLICHQMVVLHY